MGLFKSLKGLAEVTKQARQLQDQQQVQGGHEPGSRGMMSQLGDMAGTMNEQIKDIPEQSGDQQRLLAEGIPGQAVIVAMGTPARGALQFNLYLDLEVHVDGLEPYQIANQYLVPASAPLGPGVVLPVRVDPNDQTKIAIEWAKVAEGPTPGPIHHRPTARTVLEVAGSICASVVVRRSYPSGVVSCSFRPERTTNQGGRS